MKFKKMEPRSDWREKAKELGYMAALFDDPPYWIEATADPYCAVFSHSEIENIIEPATRELNELALQAVELVCFGPKSEELMEKLHIPQAFREPIRQSWKRRDRSLYGRFDFSYNNDQLKLLELNFDTAISLYEASIFQLLWFEDLRASGKLPEDCDQFNVIHEQLLRAFSGVAGGEIAIHFTSMEHSEEDEDTTKYLQSCAVLAGVPSKFMHLHELGYDEAGNLIDKEGLTIRNLFKLYPWEYLFEEDEEIARARGKSVLGPILEEGRTSFIEPVWKTILSSKGILPILWEMAPDCPWLLESYFEDAPQAAELKKQPHVRKPLFGREGGSISIIYPSEPAKSFVNPGVYGKEGFVVQALHPLPKFEDHHVLVGSWSIAGRAAGVGIRADLSPITTGMHCLFVPHYIEPENN